MNIFEVLPWYWTCIIFILQILIVVLSFEKNEFLFAIFLALIMEGGYRLIFHFGWLDAYKYDVEHLITLKSFGINFAVRYIVECLGLKLASRMSNGFTGRIKYVFIWLIASTIIYFAFNYIITLIGWTL